MNKTRIGLFFIFLTLIFPFFASMDIVFFGFMFISLGIAMFLFIYDGLASSKKVALFFSIYFIIFGLCFILIHFFVKNELLTEKYYMLLIFLGIGILFLIVFAFNVSKIFTCSKKIKAMYVGNSIMVNRGVVLHAPIFRVEYNGTEFENSTGEVLNEIQISKYTVGQFYVVNINPKNPYMMRLRKVITFTDILLFIIGISLIITAVTIIK